MSMTGCEQLDRYNLSEAIFDDVTCVGYARGMKSSNKILIFWMVGDSCCPLLCRVISYIAVQEFLI